VPRSVCVDEGFLRPEKIARQTGLHDDCRYLSQSQADDGVADIVDLPATAGKSGGTGDGEQPLDDAGIQ
jgi:hypothetical protein